VLFLHTIPELLYVLRALFGAVVILGLGILLYQRVSSMGNAMEARAWAKGTLCDKK